MKRIITSLIAALAFFGQSFAATLSPVQLLNPAGSTSGQAIVSTGPSTAPAWQTVTAGTLSPVAANTVIANATASTASPTAFAMPSCSTSGSALDWTTSTGFTCNASINAATLGGATFASPGPIGSTTPNTGKFTTLQATSTITPSSTAGIVGTTTNDNANAGSIGETISNTAGAVVLTSGTPANITSISLTAGDWDLMGNVACSAAASTVTSACTGWISTTSATVPAIPGYVQVNNQGTGTLTSLVVPPGRLSVSTTTTVYLSVNAAFTTSTMNGAGTIVARRRR